MTKRFTPDDSPPARPITRAEDPVSERREAMIDILGSWDLEGAMPTGFGLDVVHEYVSGATDIDGAIEQLREHRRNGGFSRHE